MYVLFIVAAFIYSAAAATAWDEYCEGTDCPTDGASFLGGGQEIQAADDAGTGVELSMLEHHLQTGKKSLQSAIKLRTVASKVTSAANDLMVAANTTLDNLQTQLNVLTGTYATAVKTTHSDYEKKHPQDECTKDKDCTTAGKEGFCFEHVDRHRKTETYKADKNNPLYGRRCQKKGDRQDCCGGGDKPSSLFSCVSADCEQKKPCKWGLKCKDDVCVSDSFYTLLEGRGIKSTAPGSRCWFAEQEHRNHQKHCPEGQICAITRRRSHEGADADPKLQDYVKWAREGECVPFVERESHCLPMRWGRSEPYPGDEYVCAADRFTYCDGKGPYKPSVCPVQSDRLASTPTGKHHGKCELTVKTDEGLDRRHYKHTCREGLVCLITNEYHGFDGDTDKGVCIDAADVEKLCRKRDDYDPKKERQPFAVAQYYDFQDRECEYVWVDDVAFYKTRGPLWWRVDRSGPDMVKFCAAKDVAHETLKFTPSADCAKYTKEFAEKFDAYTKELLGFPRPSSYDSKPAYCTGSETARQPCGPPQKTCICNSKGDQCKTKEDFQADIDAKNAREKARKRSRAESELERADKATCFYYTGGSPGSVSQNCGGGLVCVVGTRTPEKGRQSGKCMNKGQAKDYCHGAPIRDASYGRYYCKPFEEGKF
ncbi:unnamed protein product [Vitrella brassicaformis CCMP3155]|uniref:Uncharacterized protein n=1 Tax=Vitrella brassicaformis (strain CCMP3155) TaxID=1169540 RepID=A0A0G4GIP4_VITBC|nr:unnamed protein product [Vitrella brassicaformis CCMP3155]|eukprot:CEM29551.1 unnamed protein product [Vitrella brassicaformis CCMP3155]